MKKALATALALILIFTCLLTGCGKKSDSSSKQSANSSSTTQAAEAKPADPLALTKADFSYGGRNVNGYTNYVDCIEKSGRTRPYWFSEESSFCQKANRGLNIGDSLVEKSDIHYNSEIGRDFFDSTKGPLKLFRKYGKADEHQTAPGEPSFLGTSNGDYCKVTYHYTQNNRTYYKNFYYGYEFQSGVPYLCGISYTLS